MPNTFISWKYIWIYLNLKSIFEICKTQIYKNLFNSWTLQSGAMCVYSSWSHDKVQNMFEIIFQIEQNFFRFKFQNSIWGFKQIIKT